MLGPEKLLPDRRRKRKGYLEGHLMDNAPKQRYHVRGFVRTTKTYGALHVWEVGTLVHFGQRVALTGHNVMNETTCPPTLPGKGASLETHAHDGHISCSLDSHPANDLPRGSSQP